MCSVSYRMEGEDNGTHQAFSLDADKVAIALLAPGAVDHVTEVVAEAVSDSYADQLTLIITCANSISVTG